MKQASGEELENLRSKWRAQLSSWYAQKLITKKVLEEHLKQMMDDSGLDRNQSLFLMKADFIQLNINPRIMNQLWSVESTQPGRVQ